MVSTVLHSHYDHLHPYLPSSFTARAGSCSRKGLRSDQQS
ncbi:hypothetical protein D910_00427 [Dendroctonus ponderosae]|uniref:Uncharacterized protein n=1 Tax=Dendroctonus ponderosae TaxID=77166 RepID=U4UTK5_DENPD|nr:hypothetical protein D910_00427 [Dendroctonus ponderosae]